MTSSWAAFACSHKGAVDAGAQHHKFRDAASLAAANATEFWAFSRICDVTGGTDFASVRDATSRVTMRATLFR